ncbi:TfuA-like protein [Nocardia asteroides]|uniref:TfuA-like protein n=1 Tax=Nocardia asteroides TaxID=1824 RepID=UPI0037BB7CE8
MIHVFTGPTLSREDSLLKCEGIVARRPIRHGDLFADSIQPGDVVVIIDGVYHQARALRHKEIMYAMARGVAVLGAASIGALRAAELADVGMIGIGVVYEAFRRGLLEDDGEVAVAQADDNSDRALSWPLVTLREALRLAVCEQVLDEAHAADLLVSLRSVFYAQRTTRMVQYQSKQHDAENFFDWLVWHRQQNRFFADVKRSDAVHAVNFAIAHAGSRQSAIGEVPPTGLGDHDFNSAYFRRWSNYFAGESALQKGPNIRTRVHYQQIFDPSFRNTWTDVLNYMSTHPADGVSPMSIAQRVQELFQKPVDHYVMAPVLFRPFVDLRSKTLVEKLLVNETEADRQEIRHYLTLNNRAMQARAGFVPEAVSHSTAVDILLLVWSATVETVDDEARARGFRDCNDAVATLKCFVVGFVERMNLEVHSEPV